MRSTGTVICVNDTRRSSPRVFSASFRSLPLVVSSAYIPLSFIPLDPSIMACSTGAMCAMTHKCERLAGEK